MSKENLSEKINPFRLADAKSVLQGVLCIKNMHRLCLSLANDSGNVDLTVKFDIDPQGIRLLHGHLKTEVTLQCQRCMEPMLYEIIGDFMAGMVKSEAEAKELPDVYEPILVDEDGMLSIQDCIEDELIVSLPIVPLHDLQECKVKSPTIEIGSETVSGGDANPFKVIEILRSKSRNKE